MPNKKSKLASLQTTATEGSTIHFDIQELLEIEEALGAAHNDDPVFNAAINSAHLKVGIALKRPWALKKQRESADNQPDN